MRRLFTLGLIVVVAGGVIAYGETAMPGWWARIRYPLEYESIIAGHAQNYHLDPALLAAVIYRESKFEADAVSDAGAVGLMQLLPDTAKGIATNTGGSKFQVKDLYDPEINVRYGSFYLRRLLTKYGEVDLALAAYHAGQGNVDQWLEDGKGIAFAETRGYVSDVLDLRAIYERAYGDELRKAAP